jgi:hypothetical protein
MRDSAKSAASSKRLSRRIPEVSAERNTWTASSKRRSRRIPEVSADRDERPVSRVL